jgi:3-isopropylmalate/(R)-2-methylmalate dehydratase small subunit
MPPVTRIEGLAAPLLRENIDTDVIIPSREITSPSREGFGAKLFAPWRFDGAGEEQPGFILNRQPWRHASILIAGRNFGCGSSREMAVWALVQFGFRAVIATSFGAIFRDNCVRNALLPVELPQAVVDALAAAAQAAPLTLVIDLQANQVREPSGATHRFSLPAPDREMLLTGLDAIASTQLQHQAAMDDFVAADRVRRPWMWLAPPSQSPP